MLPDLDIKFARAETENIANHMPLYSDVIYTGEKPRKC